MGWKELDIDIASRVIEVKQDPRILLIVNNDMDGDHCHLQKRRKLYNSAHHYFHQPFLSLVCTLFAENQR